MGTDAHIVVVAPDQTEAHRLVVQATARIDDLEGLWSRFDAASEVSEINRNAGEWVGVSPETMRLVGTAEVATLATQGSFDALVGRALLNLGYDRSFDLIAGAAQTEGPYESRVPAYVQPTARARTDAARLSVCIPAGTSFDPGGIGKGLAADLIVGELIESGADGAMVNLGGDLVVAGAPPDGEVWTITISEPAAGLCRATTVGLVEGAVATSTSSKRRWNMAAGDVHHIVDPATGQNPTGEVVLATVITGAGWWAEAVATSLVGRDMLIDPPDGVAALLADAAGTIRTYGDFAEYEVEASLAGPVRLADQGVQQ